MAASDLLREHGRLGMPPEVLSHVVIATFPGASFGPQWAELAYRVVGARVDGRADVGSAPLLTLATEPPLLFQLWSQQVRVGDNPVYIEQLWHPERGMSRDLRNVGARRNFTDLRTAVRAEEFLGIDAKVERPSGRPDRTETKPTREDVRAFRWIHFDATGTEPSVEEIVDNFLGAVDVNGGRAALMKKIRRRIEDMIQEDGESWHPRGW